MTGILPGLLVISLFFVFPRGAFVLGPTIGSLAVLALIYVVALPLHSYRQFLSLVGGGPELGEPDIGASQGPQPWRWPERARVAPAPPTATRPRKSETLSTLEEVVLRRLELKAARGGELPWCVDPRVLAALGHLTSSERRRLGEAYANLDLPFGASLADVRRSYRRLMYQFHPDRHSADAVTHRLTEELSRRLAMAYSVIATARRR